MPSISKTTIFFAIVVLLIATAAYAAAFTGVLCYYVSPGVCQPVTTTFGLPIVVG